jgi:hypothetical protein
LHISSTHYLQTNTPYVTHVDAQLSSSQDRRLGVAGAAVARAGAAGRAGGAPKMVGFPKDVWVIVGYCGAKIITKMVDFLECIKNPKPGFLHGGFNEQRWGDFAFFFHQK